MPRKKLPQSVRLSAAASVVACTAGMVSDSAEAAPVWIDAPHLEGTYQPTGQQDDFGSALGDFDQDGKDEFYFFYYVFAISGGSFNVDAARAIKNPDVDIFYSSATQFQDSGYWNITAQVFEDRDAVYNAGLIYSPLPRPLVQISSGGIGDEFGTRGFLGGLFKGGDGNTYIAYLELEVIDSDNFADASLIVYDAGYALVPEPSSLALLGLGGLLLVRRRRG